MHLTIDGYGGDPTLLADEALVRDLLDHFPGEIGMTKITVPHVIRYVGAKPEDWGVSGFVIIAESHIAVHTFPDRGYVWVDVFSCKDFEAPDAIDRIRNCFELVDAETRTLDRGYLDYPHDVPTAAVVASKERKQVNEAVLAGAGRSA